eukprot:gene13621-biopygen5038
MLAAGGGHCARGNRTVARAWRGHGAGVARAIGTFWLGVARAWRGHGAGVARALVSESVTGPPKSTENSQGSLWFWRIPPLVLATRSP